MAGNKRKIYIDSPVFTHEDEEHYRYVDTEVEGLTTGRTEEEVELESLINDALGPPVSVRRQQRQQAEQSLHVAFSERQSDHVARAGPGHVRDSSSSIMRDSLEDDRTDVNTSNSSDRMLVADPARYEDLTRAASGVGASNQSKHHVMPRDGAFIAHPHQFSLQDDAEEYEAMQLERQHQKKEARRAHIPHLELIHSDDEHSDQEPALDLEINDGHSTHYAQHPYSSATSAGSGNPHHMSGIEARALPRTAQFNISNSSLLTDSLEVADYYPQNTEYGGNPSYEKQLYTNDRAYSEDQLRQSYDHANFRGQRIVQADQRSKYNDLPVHEHYSGHGPEHYSGHGPEQYSSAKEQQVSNHPQVHDVSEARPPQYSSESQCHDKRYLNTSSFKQRSNESLAAPDFVEENRHNISRKPQRTYGQIYSRKKGKENVVDSDRSVQYHQVDSASSASGLSQVKAGDGSRGGSDMSQGLSEQNLAQLRTETEQSSNPSAEQLWQARSRSLAARKESADSLPGKNRHGKVTSSQNKVHGNVRRVNGSHTVMPQPTVSAPYQHSPGVQQFSTGPITVPVQSDYSPQKVSVDINLNVVSPRPLLNQPSSSLPVQHAVSPPRDVHQYSARSQPYTNAAGPAQYQYQYQYPAPSQPPVPGVSQPFPVVPHVGPGETVQYTTDAASFPSHPVLPHAHSAPQFIADGYQQIMPQFANSHGWVIPSQPAPQHLPIRYNYSYPQPVTVPVNEVPQQLVYAYQPVAHAGHYPAINGGIAKENTVPAMASQSMNPYGVLPPVGSRKGLLKPHSAPQIGSEQSLAQATRSGSYANQYHRQRNKLDYKAYTIDDYRQLKKEMKLNFGSLGPDLENDSLRERREKIQRQQNYSRLIQERNRLDLQHAKPKQKESDGEEQLDRRRLAIEYAKNVPKPKVLPRHNSVDNVSVGSSRSAQRAAALSTFGDDTDLTQDELQKLQERHQLERQQVALLLHNNT